MKLLVVILDGKEIFQCISKTYGILEGWVVGCVPIDSVERKQKRNLATYACLVKLFQFQKEALTMTINSSSHFFPFNLLKVKNG